MSARPHLVLASASPRRRQLLEAAGYAVTVVAADVDETRQPGELPQAMVRRLATAKARAIAPAYPGQLVLAADTIVVGSGRVLGKPADLAAAEAMLLHLAGQTHEVMTGVALCRLNPPLDLQWCTTARVTFRPLAPAQIRAYFAKVNPLDKAGAYAIQEHGDDLVAKLDGDRTTVIGLPMRELQQRLDKLLHGPAVDT